MMLARRDTYHDYVTDREMVDMNDPSRHLRNIVGDLAERSGLRNCPGLGNVTVTRDPATCVTQITAWANSSMWTGRPR